MTAVDRIAAPRPPEQPTPYRFPVVATIAPVVASVAIWLLTSSPFALVFAALGPVTAVASLVDAKVGSRRTTRRELARFLDDLERVRAEIHEHHDRERAELAEIAPSARELVGESRTDPQRWTVGSAESAPVVLGRGASPSRVRIDTPLVPIAGQIAEQIAGLAGEAEALRDAAVVIDARLGIGILGPEPLAAAVARAVVMGVARTLSPAEHWCSWTGGQEWMSRLPHPAGPPLTYRTPAAVFGARGETTPAVLVAFAESEHALPAGCRVIVHVDAEGARITRHPERVQRRALRVDLVSRAQAAAWVQRLADTAERDGVIDAARALPDAVPLGPLLPERGSPGDLACSPGTDASGPITIDLVAHGPHAVVGGTTGSGKSELLVSWVLSMAAGRSPQDVSFLLVDFKGGAAFAPLEALPHVVGTVTDLDGEGATRALESLRAELRFRERAIVEAGARDVDGVDGLGRLVIVVDEFAAMLADQPELHALFADLAARGRALGVHLVLCTQRPTGVVRDAVLANADLRICMRVNNRADSTAVVGTDAAANLPAQVRGRGILALPDAEPRAVQFALASRADIDAVASRWADAPPARRPWLPPLPEVVEPPHVEAGGFGLLDVPEEQRRSIAVWNAVADGHVLVLGAGGSGKTTALAALAPRARWCSADPATAWDELHDPAPGIVVLDDADSLLARFAPEYRAAFVERLGMLLRDGPGRGIRFAIAAQRITPELQPLVSLVPGRLYLRHASRQDVILAGGETADFRADLPSGGGSWRARRVQVALARAPESDHRGPEVQALEPGSLAIVTARPDALAARLGGVVSRLAEVSDPVAVARAGGILLGDVDEWQSRWGALASLRGHAHVLIEGCSTAEYRAISRSRDLPPPLDGHPGLCWRLEPDGTASRVRLPLAEAAQASASSSGT